MEKDIHLVLALLVVVTGARVSEAKPLGAAVTKTPSNAPLARAVVPGRQTAMASKDEVAAARAQCNFLLESLNKCIQTENTINWLGLWTTLSSENPIYTNRLDFAEFQRRIGWLTEELNRHVDQLQTLIRRQGEPIR
jgi:hypothetical protein